MLAVSALDWAEVHGRRQRGHKVTLSHRLTKELIPAVILHRLIIDERQSPSPAYSDPRTQPAIGLNRFLKLLRGPERDLFARRDLDRFARARDLPGTS